MKQLFSLSLTLLMLSTAFSQTDFREVYKRAINNQIDKDYQQAIQQFDSIITGTQDANLLKMSYIFKSQCLRYAGQYKASIESIDKAIEIDPMDIASYFDKIHVLEDINEHDEIIILCEKILKMKLNSTDKSYSYFYLGKAYTAKEKYKLAIYNYDKAIDLNKTDYIIYFYRGFVYEKIKLYQSAIKDYSNAIELKVDFAQGYERRGLVKIQKLMSENEGVYINVYGKDACSDFEKSAELGSKNVVKWIELYCR